MKLRLSICLLFFYSCCFSVNASNHDRNNNFVSLRDTTINPLDDGIIRILSIGNSFSQDALETYLFDLAKNANKKIVIGNLYIGGASLELHASNVSKNKATYSFRKINLDGIRTVTKDESILNAINSDNWDYISFQQASTYSGILDSYSPSLETLVNYVTNHIKNKNTKYILHQTWAYAQTSTHKGFVNYDNNQLKMYQAIMNTSKAVFENKIYNFSMLVPSGTAIQNMRTTYIGDHLNRDGYHLDLNYGRFTAACTWYEKLFKKNVTKNNFVPKNISKELADMAKLAAHKAVLKPYQFTVLKKYAVDKAN